MKQPSCSKLSTPHLHVSCVSICGFWRIEIELDVCIILSGRCLVTSILLQYTVLSVLHCLSYSTVTLQKHVLLYQLLYIILPSFLSLILR